MSCRLSTTAALLVAAVVIAGCSSAIDGTPVARGQISGDASSAGSGADAGSGSHEPGAQDSAPDGHGDDPGSSDPEGNDPSPGGPGDTDPGGQAPGLDAGTFATSGLDARYLAPAENVSTTWDVEPKQDAVILGYDFADAALQTFDAAAGRWEFDTAAMAAAGLHEGDAMLVAGRGLGRISSITDQGGTTVVETTDATLADVIDNGMLAWDADLSFGQQWLVHDDAQGFRSPQLVGAYMVGPDGAAHAVTPRTTPLGALEWTYPQGGINYTFKIEPGKSTTRVGISAKKDGMTYAATGSISSVSSSGSAQYSDGKLASSTVGQKDLAGDLELSIAAAAGGKKDFNFTVPGIMFKYLIPVGPVPLTLSISAQVIGSIQAIGEASAQFTSKFSYSADTGFSYDGSEVETSGLFSTLMMEPDAADAAAMIGNSVNAEFGVGFPRVSLSFFEIGLVPYVQPGIVLGTSLNWGPVCKEAYVRGEITMGYDFTILGVNLANDKILIKGDRRHVSGDSCPAS